MFVHKMITLTHHTCQVNNMSSNQHTRSTEKILQEKDNGKILVTILHQNTLVSEFKA
jgi:hypothetical protein